MRCSRHASGFRRATSVDHVRVAANISHEARLFLVAQVMTTPDVVRGALYRELLSG